MIRKKFVQSIKELIFSQRCPICLRSNSDSHYICFECYRDLKRKGSLKNIENYYYLYYYDESIKRLIADFKLKNRKSLGKEIALLMKKPLNSLIGEKNVDIVLPVPISKARERERGFNQVEELLEECEISYEKVYRDKNTEHMYKFLNEEKRKENIYKAFQNKGLDLNGKTILIVDDIVTTGSTIKEMIKELTKKSTPKQIYIFSFAVSKIFKP